MAPFPNEILNVNEVPDKEVTLRVAVGNESATGKQGRIEWTESNLWVLKCIKFILGIIYCMCTTGCSNKKCACQKAGRI